MVKKKPNQNLLYINLADQMDDKDLVRVRFYLYNNPMSPARLREALFPEICHCLEKQRRIKPDQLDFDFLKEMFADLNLLSLKETVEEFVRENTNEDLSKRTALMESVDKERQAAQDYVCTKERLVLGLHVDNVDIKQRIRYRTSFELHAAWKTLIEKQSAEWCKGICISDWPLRWEQIAERQKEEIKQLKDRQILEIERLIEEQKVKGHANGYGDEPAMAGELANRNEIKTVGSS